MWALHLAGFFSKDKNERYGLIISMHSFFVVWCKRFLHRKFLFWENYQTKDPRWPLTEKQATIQYCMEVVHSDHFLFIYLFIYLGFKCVTTLSLNTPFKCVTTSSLNRLKPHFPHFPLLPPIIFPLSFAVSLIAWNLISPFFLPSFSPCL